MAACRHVANEMYDNRNGNYFTAAGVKSPDKVSADLQSELERYRVEVFQPIESKWTSLRCDDEYGSLLDNMPSNWLQRYYLVNTLLTFAQ